MPGNAHLFLGHLGLQNLKLIHSQCLVVFVSGTKAILFSPNVYVTLKFFKGKISHCSKNCVERTTEKETKQTS